MRPKTGRVSFLAFPAHLSLASRVPGEVVVVVSLGVVLFGWESWLTSSAGGGSNTCRFQVAPQPLAPSTTEPDHPTPKQEPHGK